MEKSKKSELVPGIQTGKMSKQLKIGTLNLCLGLPNKKDLVTEMLRSNNVNICCLQETEVQLNYPEGVLNCGGFTLELELNKFKKRVGIYLMNDIKYKRRTDLEKENFHVVIIDVELDVKLRIINIYRSFRPPNGMSPDVFFTEQLGIMQNALCSSCYIMGDFNLDANMNHRLDYNRKVPLNLLNNFALKNHLIQIVDFNTWSRNINGVRKESLNATNACD